MRYQLACSTLGPSRRCGRGVRMQRWMRIAVGTVLIFGMISTSPTQAQDAVGPSDSPTMPFELVSGFLVVVNGQIGNLRVMRFILTRAPP